MIYVYIYTHIISVEFEGFYHPAFRGCRRKSAEEGAESLDAVSKHAEIGRLAPFREWELHTTSVY